MLAALSIRDVVLIDRLDLALAPGLTVMTGETGAGKSILLDALGLALGARADSALVRPGAAQASVAAEFLPDGSAGVALALDEIGVAPEETLRLRRTVAADGRSRAFVNDQPVGVAALRRMGQAMVEIHGQFDQQGLLDPVTHRRLLDAFAGHDPLVAAVSAAHAERRRANEALSAARAHLDRTRADEGFLRHAVAELDALAPIEGEEGGLAEERATLSHRERIVEALRGAIVEIAGDRGAESRIAAAARLLERQADRAGGRLDPAIGALDRAIAELREAQATLDGLARAFDGGSRSLEAIEERLHALRGAARKHGVPVDALPALARELAARLAVLDDGAAGLAGTAKAADAASAAYGAAAARLSASRREAAARLDAAVGRELAPLKLAHARFATALEPLDEPDWGPEGVERVSFTVSTNPGAPAGPLARIASGGELSRFMLALKVVLATADPVPTLVFDEVDSGVGGAVAAAVGERLARLARSVQVLVVTHSPQVAARGDRQWQVRKDTREGRASTSVADLDAPERREEIARMLSGAKVTEAARAAADSLLDSGRNGRKR
ncbi:MAG: DNA repair protein RecN [Alphaproteobacteria bacterium]